MAHPIWANRGTPGASRTTWENVTKSSPQAQSHARGKCLAPAAPSSKALAAAFLCNGHERVSPSHTSENNICLSKKDLRLPGFAPFTLQTSIPLFPWSSTTAHAICTEPSGRTGIWSRRLSSTTFYGSPTDTPRDSRRSRCPSMLPAETVSLAGAAFTHEQVIRITESTCRGHSDSR